MVRLGENKSSEVTRTPTPKFKGRECTVSFRNPWTGRVRGGSNKETRVVNLVVREVKIGVVCDPKDGDEWMRRSGSGVAWGSSGVQRVQGGRFPTEETDFWTGDGERRIVEPK